MSNTHITPYTFSLSLVFDSMAKLIVYIYYSDMD